MSEYRDEMWEVFWRGVGMVVALCVVVASVTIWWLR